MYIHYILTQMEEKINILYAEDNTTAAMIYMEILEEAGYAVTLAKEGDKAWQLYETGTWDLLLLDMDLPEKDGHELIRLVREKGDQIPIVILSSVNHNHALYEGADDYLVKGCSVDDVKEHGKRTRTFPHFSRHHVQQKQPDTLHLRQKRRAEKHGIKHLMVILPADQRGDFHRGNVRNTLGHLYLGQRKSPHKIRLPAEQKTESR